MHLLEVGEILISDAGEAIDVGYLLSHLHVQVLLCIAPSSLTGSCASCLLCTDLAAAARAPAANRSQSTTISTPVYAIYFACSPSEAPVVLVSLCMNRLHLYRCLSSCLSLSNWNSPKAKTACASSYPDDQQNPCRAAA